MSTKPKLVSTGRYSFHSQWVYPIASQWFDLVDYDPTVTYQPQDCLYTDGFNSPTLDWLHSGRRVVIDRLWEPTLTFPGCFILNNPAWFWYQESLWYRHVEYNNFQPAPGWTHRALMPMRIKKDFRDYLLQILGNNVDNFIWSYQSQGRSLPNDADPADWNSQRYFNPEWYNRTAFSLVVETTMDNWDDRPFITEKTFKRIAFQHPFVIAGNEGSLKYLQSLGFETFNNLFNEKYDDIRDWRKRCRAVVTTALNYQPVPWDSITQEKLRHNHARFFDQKVVTHRIIREIIEPLLEYAETR